MNYHDLINLRIEICEALDQAKGTYMKVGAFDQRHKGRWTKNATDYRDSVVLEQMAHERKLMRLIDEQIEKAKP